MATNAGTRFLQKLGEVHEEVNAASTAQLKNHAGALESIGRCLGVLYNISTCANGCRGGDHTLQYLSGRAFNLGYTSYALIRMGYYDEALNQVRSMGELANLQSLFFCNLKYFEDWKSASKKERLNRFSPAAVRKLIEDEGGVLIMDSSTYSHLCELSTHVTPDTVPNLHSDDKRPRVGGFQQPDGLKMAVEVLETTLFCVATGFAKFLGDESEFEHLTELVEKGSET